MTPPPRTVTVVSVACCFLGCRCRLHSLTPRSLCLREGNGLRYLGHAWCTVAWRPGIIGCKNQIRACLVILKHGFLSLFLFSPFFAPLRCLATLTPIAAANGYAKQDLCNAGRLLSIAPQSNGGRRKRLSACVVVLKKHGVLVLLLLSYFFTPVCGFGTLSSIAIATDKDGLVCAIEASGNQRPYCWGPDIADASFDVPPLYGISGGGSFMCGLKVGSMEPFCWKGNISSINLVPAMYRYRSYSSIAAGANHACGVRSLADSIMVGTVDCWIVGEIVSSNGLVHPPPGLPPLKEVTAGNGYSCGLSVEAGQAYCWGDSSINPPKQEFKSLSAGAEHVCGILKSNGEARCWGKNEAGQAEPPSNVSFVALTGSYDYSCGIREDNHELACWGSFNRSSIPEEIEFLAIASGNMSCGVREDNLLVDCWGEGLEVEPPLLLFSPGLCSNVPCQDGEFAFNASSHGVLNVASPCLISSQKICAPCASLCPPGSFLSSACDTNADRECTDCSLCQNGTCQTVCLVSPTSLALHGNHLNSSRANLKVILVAAIAGTFVAGLFATLVCCLRQRKTGKYSICSGHLDVEIVANGSMNMATAPTTAVAICRHSHETFRTRAFRLAELREATNNFKELNELGRGSYGFVYRAVLPDGRQAAVKRANAAQRIHSNSKDFEVELEVLCKVRHANLVNLLGYCGEMGERLLVYEFMPHGTLHDHLHSGLSPLSWGLRLKIAIQAAWGIEYLHKDATPRTLHKHIKSSNILLDGEWVARVADFGLFSTDRSSQSPIKLAEEGYLDPQFFKSQSFTEKSDVYSFGVVLLELLSGRRPIDMDYEEPNIVEWAAQLIDKGKGACILDQSIELPKNVEPLMRMADIAELCVRENPERRPTMTDVAERLEQIGRGSSL